MGEEFKLPASSYEELVKIIKAYGQSEEQASLEELKKLCGVPESQISRNSGFLIATNIIEGGKGKTATDKGKKLARALVHEIDEEISRLWREIVNESDFLNKMVTAIKIRKGMDQQSFQSHIAYSSGQNNNQYVRTGSATVIEILKIAGLIVEVDGKLVTKEIENDVNDKSITENNYVPKKDDSTNCVKSIFKDSVGYNGINVNIEIKVIAKVNELDDLGNKIRKLLEDIKQPNQSNEN